MLNVIFYLVRNHCTDGTPISIFHCDPMLLLDLVFPLQTVWFDHISLHKKAFIFVVTTDCPSLLVTRMFVCCDQLVMVFSMTYWHPCDTDKMYSFCDHRVQCHLIIARLIQYVIVIMLLCAPLYQCTQPLYN